MKPRVQPIILFLGFVLLMSCGDSNTTGPETDPDPDPDTNTEIVSKNIGAVGGVITSADGKLTLTFPAGALGNEETITITAIDADNLGSEFDEIEVEEAYDLGPDGLQFDEPVIVSFMTDQDPLAGPDSIEFVTEFLLTSENDQAMELDNLQTIADSDEGTVMVQGQLTHFSPLVETITSNYTKATARISFSDFPNEIIASPDIFSALLVSQVNQDADGEEPFIVTNTRISQNVSSPLIAVFPKEGLTEFPPQYNLITELDYRCPEVGNGAIDIIGGFIGENATLNFRLIKNINCVEQVPVEFNLQVELEGDGTGVVSSVPTGVVCPNDCAEGYDVGTKVTLTATANQDSEFDGWSGDIGSSNNPDSLSIVLTMNQARSVTATFKLKESTGATGVIISSGTEFPQGIGFIPNSWGELNFNSACTYLMVVAGSDLAFVDPCNGETLAVLDITFEVSSFGLNGIIPLLPFEDINGVTRNWLLLTTQQGWLLMEVVRGNDGIPQFGEVRRPANSSGFISSVSGTGGMVGPYGGTNSAVIVNQGRGIIENVKSDFSVEGTYKGESETLLSWVDGTLPDRAWDAYQQEADNGTPGDIIGAGPFGLFHSIFNTENDAYDAVTTIGSIDGAYVPGMACVEKQNPGASENQLFCIKAAKNPKIIYKNEATSLELKTLNVLGDLSTAVAARVLIQFGKTRHVQSGNVQVIVAGFLSDEVYVAEYDFLGNLVNEKYVNLPSGVNGLTDVKFDPENPGKAIAIFQNTDNIVIFDL